MAPIILQKGDVVNLSQNQPGLNHIFIGLGWGFLQGNTIDLDASVFMLDADQKIPQDNFFVFYNNLESPDRSVVHTGDNRSGIGKGDDEKIFVDFQRMDSRIEELVIVVSIHKAHDYRHNFGLLSEAYIRVVDIETGNILLHYNLDAEYPTYTDVEFGRLQKQSNGEWIFVATGIGGKNGLKKYVETYT